ncbi:pentapeptide repeat-containing protein [Nocardioides mangrovi]|uniref:Pentapeptide repeat-containing protein n=1 Tax=Nocardioides mangrovi TaxID=2874580 RepID=A0ABS7UHL1_9ACTN|nr:pentapeptide repeat-containing protein [Nocardioides mangrovi]MBZ5740310.1 pentapeptide repeat-containing protein [Nocardioides mangrovi]
MSGGRTQHPRIDPVRLDDLAAGDPAELTARADLEATRFSGVRRASLDLGGARLDGVELADLVADETDLRGARLTEVRLDGVGLPVVRAAGTEWRDVEVSGRLGSVEAYEARWRGVHLVGAKISFLNLRAAQLVDVAFTDCVVEELDLQGAEITRLRFVDTTVRRLETHGARLTDVDLRGATLEVVDGLGDLRGATVSPEQLTLLAPLLADHLGLLVEE